MDYQVCLRVPFENANDAEVALNTLVVDKEPRPDKCSRTMVIKDKTILEV